LTLKNDGLHFGNVILYRNRMSAALGGSMRSLTVPGVLATAAATETVGLFIPWDSVKWCSSNPIANLTVPYRNTLPNGAQHQLIDNGKHYRVLFFDNTSKKRQQWIGFGVVRADDKEIQDLFLDHLAKHGVVVNSASVVICSKCGGAALPTDKFCGKCGSSLESEQ
jgi:hypothetical protein